MAKRRGCRWEKGQDLVEYAIVLPVLLLLIAAIMWFAMLVYAKFTIGNAAREGARTGVVYYETEDERIAAVTAAVTDRALALGLTTANLNITYPDERMLRVEVHYDYELLSFLMQAVGIDEVVTLTSAVTMRME
jgi:Flp pilus assembly protein TadG